MERTQELEIISQITIQDKQNKPSTVQYNDQQPIQSSKSLKQQILQQQIEMPSKNIPYKLLKEHWISISRPQYQRTCGISSLVSIWNYQFSRLGMGTRDPICVQQAMLKLNLIGKGSIEEGMRRNFKKTGQLTQKKDNNEVESNKQIQNQFNDKTLYQYVNSIDFGCFTGNDTLLRWYRLLCRIYGGSGRSFYFYKTNSQKSKYKDGAKAKQALVQGMNNPNLCFIYHAYDHYFCPVGYQYVPKQQEQQNQFDSKRVNEQNSQLYVMVGESSKMFPGLHVFKWNQIQLDLQTYWPKFYNIRRRKDGVQVRAGKQNEIPATSTINCIMAFQKLKQ